MRRVRKYYYNQDTHRFEKLEVSWQLRILRVFAFISATAVSALIIVSIAFKFLDSPKEKRMRSDMDILRTRYGKLQKQLDEMDSDIEALEHRDNSIYRTVFESAPIPDSIRVGQRYSTIDPQQFAYASTNQLTQTIENGISALKHRINIQRTSYDTLEKLVQAKEQMLSSIPAIQPVNNKTLDRVASGFGYRIDPIYKTAKMHTGLDFACATGTPIYATGDGTVATAEMDNGGYGNHVVINHGYGYQTLYGHMVKIKARRGERVKRGQVIGWVGSTGKSTGPHLHYEVIKRGEKIDPVHFFFNDLSAADYERMVRIAASTNQAFD